MIVNGLIGGFQQVCVSRKALEDGGCAELTVVTSTSHFWYETRYGRLVFVSVLACGTKYVEFAVRSFKVLAHCRNFFFGGGGGCCLEVC